MTPTKKAVVRLSPDSIGRFGRNLVVILGPGNIIGFSREGPQNGLRDDHRCMCVPGSQTAHASRAGREGRGTQGKKGVPRMSAATRLHIAGDRMSLLRALHCPWVTVDRGIVETQTRRCQRCGLPMDIRSAP